tara:strand:- start:76 stop:297 length:222 start_codon:yes stop_codon:yes gene_type:complete
MSSQYEEWFFIKENKLYHHGENDGFAFMRKGAEAIDTYIGPVESIKLLLRSLNKSSVSKDLEKTLEKYDEEKR